MAVNMRKSMQKKSIAALLYTFDASLPVVLIKIKRREEEDIGNDDDYRGQRQEENDQLIKIKRWG